MDGSFLTSMVPARPMHTPAIVPDMHSTGIYNMILPLFMRSAAIAICPALWLTPPSMLVPRRPNRSFSCKAS